MLLRRIWAIFLKMHLSAANFLVTRNPLKFSLSERHLTKMMCQTTGQFTCYRFFQKKLKKLKVYPLQEFFQEQSAIDETQFDFRESKSRGTALLSQK